MDYIKAVTEFHKKYHHSVGSYPTDTFDSFQAKSLALNRLTFMLEELAETGKAMRTGNMVEIADGLADLLYFVFGTAVSLGIPMDEVFAAVHKCNMSKSNEVIAGKTQKGQEFVSPNDEIAMILYGR